MEMLRRLNIFSISSLKEEKKIKHQNDSDNSLSKAKTVAKLRFLFCGWAGLARFEYPKGTCSLRSRRDVLRTLFLPTTQHIQNKKTVALLRFFYLVGLARFELAHAWVKVMCLTAWLQPIIWGGSWDSNPRSPVPQTGALTNYATSTIIMRSHAFIILQYFNHICQYKFIKYFIFFILVLNISLLLPKLLFLHLNRLYK